MVEAVNFMHILLTCIFYHNDKKYSEQINLSFYLPLINENINLNSKINRADWTSMLHLHTLPKLQQEKIKEKSLNPEGQRERESRWLHINVSNILDNKKQ